MLKMTIGRDGFISGNKACNILEGCSLAAITRLSNLSFIRVAARLFSSCQRGGPLLTVKKKREGTLI